MIRSGRHLLDVRGHIRVHPARGPCQGAQNDLSEDLVAPNIATVSHRRVEDATLAVHSSPGGWEAWPLVAGALHLFCFLAQDHMQVVGEV